MLAVFLSPIYLLFQAYILLWLYAWADSCSPALHSLFFKIPVTVLYLFFAVSPLTGFLITKEPLHHFLRVISNYWLGTLEYILLFIITFDVIRRVTGHSFFMKYRYPAMLHAEKSRDLWRLCHWPDPYGQHLRCPACKTDLCASGSGRHRKEFLSSGT